MMFQILHVELSLLAGTPKRLLAGRPNVISPPPSAPRSCCCRWPKEPAGRSLPQLADRCRSSAERTGVVPPAIEPGRNRHPDEDRGCRGGPRRPHRAPRDDNDDDFRDGTTRTRTTEMEWERTTRLGGGQGVGELAICRITTAAAAGAGNGGGNRGSGEDNNHQKAAEIGAATRSWRWQRRQPWQRQRQRRLRRRQRRRRRRECDDHLTTQ